MGELWSRLGPRLRGRALLVPFQTVKVPAPPDPGLEGKPRLQAALAGAEWICTRWGWGRKRASFKAPSPAVAPSRVTLRPGKPESKASPARDVDLSEQGSLAGVAKASPSPLAAPRSMGG